MSIFTQHKTFADRSAGDRARHRKKIEKAIRDGIHNIVAEESIIGEQGKKKFRIPVRGIKEFRFVYGENNTKQVGSAQGKDIQRGQVIGKKEQEKKPGEKAGNEDGQEFYGVELTLDQLSEYLFKDLNLPNFEKKQNAQVIFKKIKRHGYRPQGIRPRLDKKKTIIEKIKRKKQKERLSDNPDERIPFNERDLQYKHFKAKEKKTSNAVIFFVMDISGSMGREKKYLARSFFFLLYHFIRSKYDRVELVFVAHDTNAYEVNEEQFFQRGSSGGTIVSSALCMVNDIIISRYHPSSWNVYTFQCSDGDNWPNDIDKSVSEMKKIIEKSQFVGYCEIEPGEGKRWSGASTLETVFNPLSGPKFKTSRVSTKEHIWPSFEHFFCGV